MSMTFADHLTEQQRHTGYITTSSYGVEAARLRECVQAYRATGGIEISDAARSQDRAGRFLAQRRNYIEIHQWEASRYMSKIIRKARSTQTAGNFVGMQVERATCWSKGGASTARSDRLRRVRKKQPAEAGRKSAEMRRKPRPDQSVAQYSRTAPVSHWSRRAVGTCPETSAICRSREKGHMSQGIAD
jgi:hypothetical protein